MKYRALITAPYLQMVMEEYQHVFDENDIETILPPPKESLSEDELLNYIKDVDGIICGNDKITDSVLSQAPRLKVIVKWGTGTDSIDKEAAGKRGIPVRNTVNAFTDPVADTVFGYILSFVRGTFELDQKIRKGIWEKKLYKAMNEYSIGIIGMGNIGNAIAKRAQAFGMQVRGNDIAEKPYEFMVPLETLLKESDFVTLNCDLNPTSYQLINKDTLAMMKPTAYLLNAARGPIVKESDLIDALQSGTIAGAGLDVFEKEPLALDHPFIKMPNVIMSPHNANSGHAAWEKVHKNSINSLLEELAKHG